MYTGRKYGVPGMVERCTTFLQAAMDAGNVCTIMEQAHIFDERSLWQDCLALIRSQADIVFNISGAETEADLHSLCGACLGDVVRQDELDVPEDSIFTACCRWAEQRCHSSGLDVTDHNIRHFLKNILPAIRFSLMGESNFHRLIENTGILTQDEKLAIYQQFNANLIGESDFNNQIRFSSIPRHSSKEYKAERFKGILGGGFDHWDNDNQTNGIAFKASRDVTLTGLTLFAPLTNNTLRGSICLYDETNVCLTAEHDLEIVPQGVSQVVDIRFPNPVLLEEGRWYTATQKLQGGKSYFGTGGLRQVRGEGVLFSFRNSPTFDNTTDVQSGQIHALIYR